ncbi:DUF2235 domain-containing protein [Actibacterium ureilyticum]|uniref:DUF2235 domain-containing protein n=1 Tax=Actibacterium ureilyticum TaxID=1590614 RepID=UPI000BAACFB5|nr:DUF2235 domain-containing protein [Actibacterium ureilyticum]
MSVARRIWNWIRERRLVAARTSRISRQPVTHVIILDGTNSSLDPGSETHAGTLYKLLCEMPATAQMSLYYDAGIQWMHWRRTHDVAFGRGINRQIRRAYGYLASRYHPGDRIFLFGYSRGAFAVRSLAGVMDRVGLLTAEHAIERNVRLAYRHYENAPISDTAEVFARQFCHDRVTVEMVGVWDTVKALGIRLPLFWMLTEPRHAFHNHALSDVVRHGYHALALDETRAAFRPLLWRCPPDWTGRAEQVWFRGAHGDVGGQLGGYEPARPLANIPLVWMLDKAEGCGLSLPPGWRDRFPCDATAPSVGTTRGWGKLFLYRRRRRIGWDASERLHETARDHPRAREMPLPDPEENSAEPTVSPVS